MGLLDVLFGNKNDKIKDLLTRDAIIIDVRTVNEYKQGAIPGSKNIPLQVINGKINDIKKLNKTYYYLLHKWYAFWQCCFYIESARHRSC